MENPQPGEENITYITAIWTFPGMYMLMKLQNICVTESLFYCKLHSNMDALQYVHVSKTATFGL
jgi:hypothetical protein